MTFLLPHTHHQVSGDVAEYHHQRVLGSRPAREYPRASTAASGRAMAQGRGKDDLIDPRNHVGDLLWWRPARPPRATVSTGCISIAAVAS